MALDQPSRPFRVSSDTISNLVHYRPAALIRTLRALKVAKEASNVILMDDNFYSIVRAFVFLSTVPV